MPYIGKPQSADAFRVTPSNIDSALKGAVSGSNDSEMTLATASIAAITASISRIDLEIDTNAANITLATASIAAITASLGQPVNTDSNVTFNNITSTGTLTAVEVHTTFVSSSIAVASGSNNFGDAADDHHSFTGSLSVSGSGTITGSLTVEGSSTIDDLTATSITATGDISGSTTGSFGHIRIGTGGNIDLSSDDVIIRNLVSNKDLIFKGNDGGTEVETMRINYSGNNIGIGTSSPGGKFHVDDDRSTAYNGAAEIAETVLFRNKNGSDGTGVNNVTSIGLQVGDGATSQGFINYVRTGDNNGKFTFSQRTASSTYVEAMTISGSNVGIGTASPAYPLDIVSTINNGAALAIRGDVDADGRFSGIQFGDNGSTSYSKGGIFYEGKDAYARGALHFALESGTGADNADLTDARMTINYDGSVGIHTTSPNVGSYNSERGVLTIGSTDNGSANNYANLELQGHAIANNVTVGDISWFDHTNQNAIVRGGRDSSTTTGFLAFFTNGGSGVGERMRIDSDGNVGIGTDSLGTTHLHVKNNTVNNDGSSFTGIMSEHIITAGSSDASDTYFGIRNHLEHDQSGQGFGSMYGIFNNNQCTLASGQMTQVTGISNNNSMDAGDIDYMRGILNFNNFDGGEVDNNIVTLYNLTEIASGGTIRGSVYAIENDHDADTNPAGEMLGYYGIAGTNADYHMKLYSHTQSSLVMRWHDNGAIDHENSISSNASLDYAEYFESEDGNSIPIGTTVKLNNGKIVACEEGDTPIGVVRPLHTSAVVGGAQPFHWQGMYETDDYGGYIMESFSTTKWEEEVNYDTYRNTVNGDGGVLGGTVKKECYEQKDGSKKYIIKYRFHTDRIPSDLTVPSDARVVNDKNKRKRISSDYDHSQSDSYQGREERDEWHIVGLLGQIQITKGQPLASNWIKMKDVSDTVEMYFVK